MAQHTIRAFSEMALFQRPRNSLKTGHQGSKLRVQMSTNPSCPPNSLQSFPIALDVTPSDVLYNSVNEAITIDFQWATRTTPPALLDPRADGGTIDEESSGHSSGKAPSTLRFDGSDYTLDSVQICQATHKSWVLPLTDQGENREDMICTFKANSTVSLYTYILFVVPLIRTDSGASPSYIAGLADGSLSGPFSVEDAFPKNKNALFAYYATCLSGYTGAAPITNVYVFVSTEGVRVNVNDVQKIIRTAGFTATGVFPAFVPPFMTSLRGGSISVNSGFSKYVLTTTSLLNASAARAAFKKIDVFERDDSTDAYKCVPLDPDKDVRDGKLAVDVNRGTLLTDVLDQRNSLRGEVATGSASSVGPGRLEKYLGSAIGIILTILLVAGVLYGILQFFVFGDTPTSSAGAASGASAVAAAVKPGWMSMLADLPLYIILAVLIGFAGFVLGMSLA